MWFLRIRLKCEKFKDDARQQTQSDDNISYGDSGLDKMKIPLSVTYLSTANEQFKYLNLDKNNICSLISESNETLRTCSFKI